MSQSKGTPRYHVSFKREDINTKKDFQKYYFAMDISDDSEHCETQMEAEFEEMDSIHLHLEATPTSCGGKRQRSESESDDLERLGLPPVPRTQQHQKRINPGPLYPLRRSPRKKASKQAQESSHNLSKSRRIERSSHEGQNMNNDSDSNSEICGIPIQKKNTSTPVQRTSTKTKTATPTVRSTDEFPTPAVATPTGSQPGSAGRSYKQLLQEIIGNQKEMMQDLSTLKKNFSALKAEFEKRKASADTVEVPNKIRVAVKDFFNSGQERNLTWNLKKRYTDEENEEMTEYIKNGVQGISPDTSEEVIHGAIKRYFTSKKEAANRASKNKTELHKKRQATYERKKEKLKRRLSVLDKKTNWSSEKRQTIRNALESAGAHKYMSSDEEGEDGFISHPYSWESEAFRAVKSSLDRKFLETCPARTKRLLTKRTQGSIREQMPPNVSDELSWIIN